MGSTRDGIGADHRGDYGADYGPAVVEWDSDIVNNDGWNYDTGWEHVDDHGYGEPVEDWVERTTEERLADLDKLTKLVGSYAKFYFDNLDTSKAHIFTIRAHALPDGGNVSIHTELLEITDIVRSLCTPRPGGQKKRGAPPRPHLLS